MRVLSNTKPNNTMHKLTEEKNIEGSKFNFTAARYEPMNDTGDDWSRFTVEDKEGNELARCQYDHGGGFTDGFEQPATGWDWDADAVTQREVLEDLKAAVGYEGDLYDDEENTKRHGGSLCVAGAFSVLVA